MSNRPRPAVLVDRSISERKPARLLSLAALLLSAALLLLPWLVKLDGKSHADWQQLLGRFHPLLVHLPIGLLVLVPVLEIAGAWRPVLREAVAFVLSLAFITSLGSLTLGYLLAYGSGEAGSTVTRHMWGGIALVIGIALCLLVRPPWSARTLPFAYPLLLTCTLLTLAWTAHQGGSITHGRNYLTEYLPTSLKSLILGNSTQVQVANPTSFYAKHIHPIFDANCISCHGESKKSGGLRLDSYDQLMRGGKDGRAIAPGNPDESLLLHRVTLPASHKQFMPAEGKPPLRAVEIAWIRAWIQQGASPTDSTVAGISRAAVGRTAHPRRGLQRARGRNSANGKKPGCKADARIGQALRRPCPLHGRCRRQLRRCATAAVSEIRAIHRRGRASAHGSHRCKLRHIGKIHSSSCAPS